MKFTRRSAMKCLGAAVPGALIWPALAQTDGIEIERGPFQPTRDSLRDYQVPQWFRDAKFGIWAHWGPQSAPEYGDWYARRMYIEGGKQYNYHVKRYGHPSKFGFKDVIPTWKAEKFDPEHLMDLYHKAGAKYFVSMGVHHDNFDLWNSKHTRWNAVKMGPKKDIVGMFRKAALARGLKFGVSEHLWISYKWFAVSHGSDKSGALAGVPYDGADPKYADLYHQVDPSLVTEKFTWDAQAVPEPWKRRWLLRIKDLLDQYHPDLLYTDGHLPFEEYGLRLAAHLYNSSAKRNGGRVESVYTTKGRDDCAKGTCVFDVERGLVESIWPEPWQTDTCIGDWHYNREAVYKSPKLIVDMLVDIVSRNGNLLLNFPLPSSGALDENEVQILSDITRWMAVNGEAIYGTRPWKIFGEGPGTVVPAKDRAFNERSRKLLTADDVRFATKGGFLYAFLMGWPERETTIRPLRTGGEQAVSQIRSVEMLGFKGKLEWKQDAAGLTVSMPTQKPCDHAVALRIAGA